MKNARIQLKDITKSYYSETTVTQALRKINMTLSEGEFVAITGESGSGKSTLLNIIGGMENFDDGEMFVDGEQTSQYDDADWEEYRRNKIGYVFQDYSLIGHYTVIDNVVSALLIMEKEIDESRETAREYLKKVGLEGFEDHKASELSSGQKQRLSIARALAKGTGIIVADEPTGNLDTETGDQIIQLLKELSKDCLVIMVTHNYDQVEPYATRKIRLHDGEMISDVTGVPESAGDRPEESGKSPTADGGDETGSRSPAADGGDETGSKSPTADGEDETGSRLSAADGTDGEAGKSPQTESRAKKSGKKISPSDRKAKLQTRTAAYFAQLNRHTQKGRAFLFTIFLVIISAVAFIFIGELYQHADDIHTRSYDKSAFYREDDTRLSVKRQDGGAITDKDLEAIRTIPDVRQVDSCDLANDINYYIEEDTDYKYIYGILKNWSGTTQTVEMNFLRDDKFVMSTDCVEESDLRAGRMPESRNEMILYSDDDSMLNKRITCFFTSNNLWEQDNYYRADITVCGLLKKKTEQVYFSRDLCRMLSTDADSDSFELWYNWEPRTKAYASTTLLVPVIADDLVGNQVRLSRNLGEEAPVGDTLFHLGIHDSDGRNLGGSKQQVVKVLGEDQRHESTATFMEVSREFYDKYYQPKNQQASVYITDYARTDQVLGSLEKLGYTGVSTYRVSCGDYDQQLVDNRLMIIGISAGGLLALFAAAVLIMRSLMKIRVKDYFILKFIGMRLKMIGRISYFELFVYSLYAMVIAVVAMWILRFVGVPVLTGLMWYYRWDAYLLYGTYLLAIWLATAASFNHLLRGKLRT